MYLSEVTTTLGTLAHFRHFSGLSYSSLSKRAGIVRKGLSEVITFKNEFNGLNALIKM
jgi:hypothetical protein